LAHGVLVHPEPFRDDRYHAVFVEADQRRLAQVCVTLRLPQDGIELRMDEGLRAVRRVTNGEGDHSQVSSPSRLTHPYETSLRFRQEQRFAVCIGDTSVGLGRCRPAMKRVRAQQLAQLFLRLTRATRGLVQSMQ
jgi:hypothetical protein